MKKIKPYIDYQELLESWPHPLPEFDLEPASTAILIIDMQHCLIDRRYGLARLMDLRYPKIASYFFPRLTKIVIPNNIKLLQFFRRNGLRVIFVTLGAELSNGSDLLPRRRKRNMERNEKDPFRTTFHKGEFEHSVIEELKPLKSELVINKNSTGAFNSSNIDQILRNMRIEGLIITGAITNGCVETTARDAADRGYYCILVEDACAAFDESLHHATLVNFATIFGKVWTTREVIEKLNKKLTKIV